jgi:hypothetical protein
MMMKNKKGGTNKQFMEIKVEQNLWKPCEPNLRGLFKAINGLVQAAYMT